MKLRYFLAALLALGLLTACPAEEENGADSEYQVVPSQKSLSIDVPDDASTGGLIGETAEYYQFTKGISTGVNAHVGALLIFLDTITKFPPSERGEDYRMWGPSEPEGLEMNSWRLIVKKIDEGRFSFSLEGRNKASTSEDDWLATIVGEVTPGEDTETGIGTLELLFDNSYTLEASPCEQGTVQVDWDNTGDDRIIDVYWKDFVNHCEDDNLANAHYSYQQSKAEASGTFDFVSHENIHEEAENKPGIETLEVRSRWLGDGAGRSDVLISGEEVSADLEAIGLTDTQVHATQCWNTLFASVYEDTLPAELAPYILPTAGDVAECAFQEAELPQL